MPITKLLRKGTDPAEVLPGSGVVLAMQNKDGSYEPIPLSTLLSLTSGDAVTTGKGGIEVINTSPVYSLLDEQTHEGSAVEGMITVRVTRNAKTENEALRITRAKTLQAQNVVARKAKEAEIIANVSLARREDFQAGIAAEANRAKIANGSIGEQIKSALSVVSSLQDAIGAKLLPSGDK